MQQLANLGKRTSRTDPEFIKETYACAPNRIRCVVAEDDDGTVLGLQVLKVAADGNPLDAAPGWGIIGTHIRPDAARYSIGRACSFRRAKQPKMQSSRRSARIALRASPTPTK